MTMINKIKYNKPHKYVERKQKEILNGEVAEVQEEGEGRFSTSGSRIWTFRCSNKCS